MKTRHLIFILVFALMTVGGLKMALYYVDEFGDKLNDAMFDFLVQEIVLIGIFYIINRLLTKKEKQKIALQ